MNTTPRRQWRPQLSHTERVRAWVFLALYVLVFPRLMGFAQRALGDRWAAMPAEASLLYHFFMLAFTVLIFWSLLRSGLEIFADNLPENLVAMGTGFVLWALLAATLGRIPLPLENPSVGVYLEQFAAAPQATFIIIVLLFPLAEEALFRGLIFGSLRRTSRVLGYIVSILAFAFFKAQQFAFTPGDVNLPYLMLTLQYIPMGAAFTWCYDKGGSIWGCVGLHMVVNAASLALLVR